MLHLSLLRLPRRDPAWRTLDPYQAHQLAWKAFSGFERGDRPFLFHLSQRAGAHSLLVQSRAAPDWSFLGEGADVRTKRLDPGRFEREGKLSFFLRANPTADQRQPDGTTRRSGVGLNPRRAFERMGRPGEEPSDPEGIAAWRAAELRRWLDRRAEASGFVVEQCEAGPIVSRTIWRPRQADAQSGAAGKRGKGRRMTFHEVEYTGTLRVTDATKFARVCAEGLGRGRAYGYGLLMLRPGGAE